jgi:hypothetical protein
MESSEAEKLPKALGPTALAVFDLAAVVPATVQKVFEKVATITTAHAIPPTMTTHAPRTVVREREGLGEDEEFNGFQTQTHDEESDKDSTEEELERLVFGDASGFRDGLKGFRESHELSRGKELVLAEDGGIQTEIEDVDDADVCCASSI